MKYLKKFNEGYTRSELKMMREYDNDFPDWKFKQTATSYAFTYKYDDKYCSEMVVERLLQNMVFISWFDNLEDDECIGECAFRVIPDEYEYDFIKKLLDFAIIFKESFYTNEILNRNNIKTNIDFFAPDARTLEELEELVESVNKFKEKYDYILKGDEIGLL